MSITGSTGNLDPNLRLGDRKQGRYPSPFFDLSQQYMPPTMKELFKWCYFYATTNAFIGPALNKVARYPVTDLVFESSSREIQNVYTHLFSRLFQIKAFLMECNLDMCTYGNCFTTIYYPFTRFVKCRRCGYQETFKTAKVVINHDLKVKCQCKKCNYTSEAEIIDRTFRSKERVKLLRLNPQQIDIKYNEVSGDYIYLYTIPDKLKRQIMTGDKKIFETTPLIYIEAIKKKLKIELNSQNIFHLRRPTVAGKDFGWGMPLIMNVLKDIYYFYSLRRGQEAIINEFITPLDMISPAPAGQGDPYRHANLATFRKSIEQQIERHRRDPNFKAIVPFPIQYQRIGGDGKAMLLQGELDFLAKSIIGGMGIPQEFVYGGLTWSGSSVTLRTLENEFMHHRTQLLNLCFWIKDRMRVYLGLPDVEDMRFLDFKMADDVQRLAQVINLEQTGKISTSTMLTELGYDFETEQKKRIHEAHLTSKVNHEIAKDQQLSTNKLNEANMREQSRMNRVMSEMQMQDAGMGGPGIDPNNPDQEQTGGQMGGQMGGQPGMVQGPQNQGQSAAQSKQTSGQNGGQGGANVIDFASAQQAQNLQANQVQADAYTPQQLVDTLAARFFSFDEAHKNQFISEIQQTRPELIEPLRKRIQQLSKQLGVKPSVMMAPGSPGATSGQSTPNPAGENRMPRGKGAV